jgi:hypothetical protein
MPFDTSPEAAEAQAEAYRRMGPQGRLQLTVKMSLAVRELAKTRLRSEHPYADEAMIHDLLIKELYGVDPRPR